MARNYPGRLYEKLIAGRKLRLKDWLLCGSIAAVVEHCVALAEARILKPVGELRLLVDQTRGGLH